MIKNLIEVELGYINTENPDFSESIHKIVEDMLKKRQKDDQEKDKEKEQPKE